MPFACTAAETEPNRPDLSVNVRVCKCEGVRVEVVRCKGYGCEGVRM